MRQLRRLTTRLILGSLLLSNFHNVSVIKAQDKPTFDQLIEQAVQASDDAQITVGILQEGQPTYEVYTTEGVQEPDELHEYEVGSITKTFTGTLIARAELEGLLNINDAIDEYLALPANEEFPTIRQLLTHTSSYPSFIENQTIINNLTQGTNPYHGVTREELLEEVADYSYESGDYPFAYSNFNASVLGLILEAVYGESYNTLIKQYIKGDLQLEQTHLYEGETTLGNNWIWSTDDAYAPAGALISNIEDMLMYADYQLGNQVRDEVGEWIDASHQSLAHVNATTSDIGDLGLRTDDVAYQWLLNTADDIIWHDGGTGGYTAYIGLHPVTDTAVVVLSNVPMDQGIPSNLIGSVLLLELIEDR